MLRIALLILLLLFNIFPLTSDKAWAEEEIALPDLAISEVQTGGCILYDEVNSGCLQEDVSQEFIELYNPTLDSLQVHGWAVQYVTASGKTIRDLAVFDGDIMPQSYVLLSQENHLQEFRDLSFAGPLARTGGHIQIVDDSNNIIDLVGWGTASATSSWPKIPEILPGYSAKRILPGDPLEGSGLIYTPSTLPMTPTGGGYLPVEDENNNEDNDEDLNSPGLSSNCEDAIISEVLPNPSGSDSGREFIELYNPTAQSIFLENCKLQTSSKSTFFTFNSEVLKSKEYKAFYDTGTSLNLANASGGTVWLLNHDDVEIDEVTYPADMEDDVSYAIFDDEWKSTYIPTPSEENILQATKPCPAGQYRSLETNRCRSSVLASSLLKPCEPGKVRNPATNRCRSTSLASALKPCDAGQFRNPETNRCKKIGSGSTLKPCRPGQERNPETNRCRKVEDAILGGSLDSVKDIPSPSVGNKVSWWFAGASMIGAVGYAGFEWRKEFLTTLSNLKSKLLSSS